MRNLTASLGLHTSLHSDVTNSTPTNLGARLGGRSFLDVCNEIAAAIAAIVRKLFVRGG